MSNGYRPSQPSPRRLDPRVYRRRRIAAAVVLGVVALCVYGVGSALFGSSDGSAASPSSPSISQVVHDGHPTTLPTTTLPPTTTTELKPKARTTPTKKDPAELLVYGDSDAGAFGPYLKTLMDQTGIATTKLDYKIATGLARPDYFNWPEHMQATLPEVNPDIVIVTFGGNDAQALRNADKTWVVAHRPGAGGDDSDWKKEYGKRVGQVMDYLGGDNRTLIWVGIPNASDPTMTARLKVQDEVVRAEAAKRPKKVVYIDTWKRFSGRNNGYGEYVIDPRDGEGKDVRGKDGFHLNVTGAEILALDIAEAVKDELRARGAKL
jgi:hypothetical protein